MIGQSTVAPRPTLMALLYDTGGWSDPEEDVPSDGPPTTYVAFITPHESQVSEYDEDDDDDEYDDEDEDEDDGKPRARRSWPDDMNLDGTASVLVYAVPDELISAARLERLELADGDRITYDYELGNGALEVATWFDRMPGVEIADGGPSWAGHLAYDYIHNRQSWGSYRVEGAGVPSRLVTIMLPPEEDYA